MNVLNANRASGAAVAFIAGSVIFAVLTVAVRVLTNVPAVDADAGAARSQMLATMRASETTNLTEVGWVDVTRGVVRLPIETAMQKTLQVWQNPAQARADLIAREEKASAPAPVAPAKPNLFE